MNKNPFGLIKKDLIKLSQIAIDLGGSAPDFHQVAAEKAILRVLKTYRFKKRELPKFKSI
jgi:hypothetical protein